jgi:DNA invertase Pin-like site-specific DNA recombinase
MLKRQFDPQQPHRAVTYLRMSSDEQNPRSPEQQLAEIRRRLAILNYNWPIVKVYSDAAITGRLTRKRPQYQQMLRDIKSGAVQADLILVDTTDRLGRIEELPEILRRLRQRHGVLLLSALNNFLDPTTPQGRALEMVECLRATEENRAKAHMVVRSKLDLVEQGKWPGAAAPFGYMLEGVMRQLNGRDEIDYYRVVPDPRTRWIIAALFQKARETFWGAVRLTKWLNAHPDILAELKPFHFTTVGRWLDNPLYKGELWWNVHCTGIIDDVRVVEKNPDAEIVRKLDFCEPLVCSELWDEVRALRAARSARVLQSRQSTAEARQTTITVARGLALKYLLSGLVFCECGLRMVASSTTAFTTKAGETRRYTSYVCPGFRDGACENRCRIPEAWLRRTVVAALRDMLFPTIS